MLACNDNGKVLDVNIDFHQISNASFSDYYTLEKIIPLETNDSSIFDSDYIDEYIFCNNKIFVGVDEGKDIKVFGANGKYLYTINRSGNGPEEYGPEYRSIYLVDSLLLVRNYNGIMLYYDLSGNYIKKMKNPLEVWSNQVGLLPDGNFIVNLEINGLVKYQFDDSLSKKPYYSVHIYSPNGKLLKTLLEQPKYNINISILSSYKGFYNDGITVWMAPYIDNQIYQYNASDTTLIPIFRVNIEGIDFSSDLNLLKDNKNAIKFLNRKGSYYLIAATQNYLCLDVLGDEDKHYFGIINKTTARVVLFDMKNNMDNVNNLIINNIAASNLNNHIVVQIGYYQLVDKNNQLINSPIIKNLIKRGVDINENMNPILCIYKEK